MVSLDALRSVMMASLESFSSPSSVRELASSARSSVSLAPSLTMIIPAILLSAVGKEELRVSVTCAVARRVMSRSPAMTSRSSSTWSRESSMTSPLWASATASARLPYVVRAPSRTMAMPASSEGSVADSAASAVSLLVVVSVSASAPGSSGLSPVAGASAIASGLSRASVFSLAASSAFPLFSGAASTFSRASSSLEPSPVVSDTAESVA